ncbi:EthD domain-containing protein [Nocardioides litoris]|uniref:EthD domain-containing protein n=1 Tax=Nocardioides litoris TaxID=1926648 RepID=UPI001FE7D047|nr:EthD domain-containing protein [Nocardioides litoris]
MSTTVVDPSGTKLVWALWGADHTALRAPALAGALATLGVTHLQVNLDDEHVADALRIPAGPTPVGAVVSTWLPDDAAALDVRRVLAEAASALVGWRVEERRPLAPPETWDGDRSDCLANVAILRRPPELEHAEWRRRWLEEHTPVAIATQATFGYLQNVVLEQVGVLPDGVEPVAAVVEELFPAAAVHDVHAFYGSGGDQAELDDRITRLMASVARIGADRGIDLVPTSRYLHDLGRLREPAAG